MDKYPNLEEEVGGSIPGCEISSLLTKNVAMWSTASLVIWCWSVGLMSKNKERKNYIHCRVFDKEV